MTGDAGSDGAGDRSDRATVRLDKWLWYARFFKSRGLATKLIAASHVRVNGTRVSKPATAVGAGDVLTFPQGRDIRVVEVLLVGTRRGPAPEAQMLYLDRSPVVPRADKVPPTPRFEGKGRPTKKDRRNLRPKGGGPLE